MTFRISYKFLKCLADRITYSGAGSILSAGRISFKFKNGLGPVVSIRGLDPACGLYVAHPYYKGLRHMIYVLDFI